MKTNWKFREKIFQREDEKRLFPELEIEIEDLLRERGISSLQEKEAFVAPAYDEGLLDPFLLLSMDVAVERAQLAIKEGERICIYGDYDADGVTGSAVLLDFFKQLEMFTVPYLPDRATEGYGVNNKAIDYIKEQGVSLIITVDCGVSNAQEIEYAKELGIDVIILDHHHIPENMPKAVAVVDPKRKGDKYPNKNLAGVGVAFKFLQALASKLEGYDPEQLKWLLDLVAIGTVADCVPLSGENRMLVKFGLTVLSKTKRVGLHQMFQVGRISIDEEHIPSSYDISFQIAPRINAAGRMDHANAAQRLLLCDKFEEAEARLLALDIEDKNKHRQKVTAEIVKEVHARVIQNEDRKIIIEASSHWSFGIVGLAAGKIVDVYSKPTILLQNYEKDGVKLMRASCRSIPKFNMIEALERNNDLLIKYGGHSQAAGLTLKEEDFEEFFSRMEGEMKSIDKKDLVKEIEIDSRISFEKIGDKLVGELGLMEPFGFGNIKPAFLCEKLRIKQKRAVGSSESHLKLQFVSDEGVGGFLDAIGFGIAEKFKNAKEGDLVDLVCNLEFNEWNGSKKVQAMIVDMEIG